MRAIKNVLGSIKTRNSELNSFHYLQNFELWSKQKIGFTYNAGEIVFYIAI